MPFDAWISRHRPAAVGLGHRCAGSVLQSAPCVLVSTEEIETNRQRRKIHSFNGFNFFFQDFQYSFSFLPLLILRSGEAFCMLAFSYALRRQNGFGVTSTSSDLERGPHRRREKRKSPRRTPLQGLRQYAEPTSRYSYSQKCSIPSEHGFGFDFAAYKNAGT